MSVSALGGYIYTNQASPLASQLHQQAVARPDMMQFSLNQLVIEKEKEVEKVTELADGHGIDPDRDNHDNSEMYNKDKKEPEENSSEDEKTENADVGADGLHHLDIKV